MAPKLSICIPTYNRYPFIDELLGTIVEHVERHHLQQDVEVVVSDNASTDGFDKTVARFSTVPYITITRLPDNQGADFNFYNVASMATGEYIWWCCSDDGIEHNGIPDILNAIVSNKDIYYLSHFVYDIGLTERIRLNPERHHIGHSIQGAIGFVEIGYLLGYIGALVIRREAWTNIRDPLKFRGTQYVHVAWCAEIMCVQNGEFYIVDSPIVKHRHGNDSFLQGNRLRRTMIDIDGYKAIGEQWLAPKQFRAFYNTVIDRHVTWALLLVASSSFRKWIDAISVATKYLWIKGYGFRPKWIFRLIALSPIKQILSQLRNTSKA